MSDEREDWRALLEAWPTVEPTAGFADRVVDALAAPPMALAREPQPAPSRPLRGLLLAAVAAVLLLIPIALRRPPRAPSPSQPVMLANGAPPSFDLGPQRD